jgi:hypothetical protein
MMMMTARPAMLLCGVALLAVVAGTPGVATAQVNCEAIPAGPDRTDCYIGLSRIYRQKAELSATIARQQADAATLRQVTGKRPKKKSKRQ